MALHVCAATYNPGALRPYRGELIVDENRI